MLFNEQNQLCCSWQWVWIMKKIKNKKNAAHFIPSPLTVLLKQPDQVNCATSGSHNPEHLNRSAAFSKNTCTQLNLSTCLSEVKFRPSHRNIKCFMSTVKPLCLRWKCHFRRRELLWALSWKYNPLTHVSLLLSFSFFFVLPLSTQLIGVSCWQEGLCPSMLQDEPYASRSGINTWRILHLRDILMCWNLCAGHHWPKK